MSAMNLQTFLQDLEKDPAFKQTYLKDPVGVMTAAGVAPAHQKLLLNNDRTGVEAVLQSIGNSLGGAAITAASTSSSD